MSYVHDVRHRISMSYVRHVRHRNIRCRSTYDIATMRCRMFIRYRRSDVRHRMLSSYTTSYVLTCISCVLAYNIAYDIAYDIVCDVHSIGFGAGFRGFKKKNPLLMYSTIRFGTASKAAPQGRHLFRARVGVELAIKRLLARCLDH
jgi:hypothetical protein